MFVDKFAPGGYRYWRRRVFLCEGIVKKSVVIVVLLFAAGAVIGADVVSFDSGVCRFTLYDYKLDETTEADIRFGVTQILDTYKKVFGFVYPDDFKVRILIFDRRGKFKKYQKQQRGSIISYTGYCGYSNGNYEAVMWKCKNTVEMLELLMHEVNHVVLNSQAPACPGWINEGLSEYFEVMDVIGQDKGIFLRHDRHKWSKHWAKKGFPIALEEFVNLNGGEWAEFRKKNINTAYTMAYSLMYFMMESENNQEILKKFLWRFKKLGRKADSVKMINELYPGGFAGFERDWRQWLLQAKAYRSLYDYKKNAGKKR